MSGVLQGQVALVTGGSRGIGRAIALRLAADGAEVVLNYLENDAAAEEAVQLVQAANGVATRARFDIADAEGARAGVQSIVDRAGRLDILVNNAGTTADALVLRLKEEEWERALRVNLTGAFHCTKVALRAMDESYKAQFRCGALDDRIHELVRLRSAQLRSSRLDPEPHRGIDDQLLDLRITVNAVAPGFVETDMTAALSEEQRAFYTNFIPAGRVARPEEVAAAVAFLASPAAGYITGHVLHVNGGLYM